MAKEKHNDKIAEARARLLDWYDRHGRDLPWRYKNASTPDPYKVWLSEIMCQQTTVQAVIPYFLKFTQLWPGVQNLAAAKQEEVMHEWAGLGYYARARNLHKCAQVVANDLGGKFPDTQAGLQTLPGIGDYTSAAISAIAFNRPATVMDGNIERVISRYFAITQALPKSKPKLKTLTARFFENFYERPGDLAQAFMDLGASICTPKSPKCMICPLNAECQAREQGIAEALPAKEKKKPVPKKHGYVYWIENEKGEILLERRDPKAMLGGMLGFPTSEWLESTGSLKHPEYLKVQPENKNTFITHTFTHFQLKLYLVKGTIIKPSENHAWHSKKALEHTGFPTLFKKACKIWLADK